MTLSSELLADTHLPMSEYRDQRLRDPIDRVQRVRIHKSYPNASLNKRNSKSKIQTKIKDEKLTNSEERKSLFIDHIITISTRMNYLVVYTLPS